MIEPSAVFMPDWVSPPGDTIADLLEENGWTQAELAERTGFTRKHINLLIKGDAVITEDAALRLERVLGSSARFWLTREIQYREALARKAEQSDLNNEIGWLEEIPLKEMIQFDWIERKPTKHDQIVECLRFFCVASVKAWRAQYTEVLSTCDFRSDNNREKSIGAAAAWLRWGELQATKIETKPFDKARFNKSLQRLRSLTVEPDPNVFIPELTQVCSDAGIAVVIARAPKGCPVSGATRWLTPNKALLMLSLRYKSNDQLWFSFFHEAGHLMLHSKKMQFLELENNTETDREEEADRFAADLLIPPKHLDVLSKMRGTVMNVTAFASELGIAPGIVVGRMQKEGWLPWDHLNKLKVRYRWTSS